MTLPDIELTQLLNNWRNGESHAMEQLAPIINQELHKLAVQFMQKESDNHTLQATALVNEAYIKLAGSNTNWQDKVHFMAVAANIMRHILVDHAKAKNTLKRRANKNALPYDDALYVNSYNLEDIVLVDELLNRLESFDSRASKMLELTLFGGLTNPEVAEVMDVSLSTVERELRVAKAWINKQR